VGDRAARLSHRVESPEDQQGVGKTGRQIICRTPRLPDSRESDSGWELARGSRRRLPRGTPRLGLGPGRGVSARCARDDLNFHDASGSEGGPKTRSRRRSGPRLPLRGRPPQWLHLVASGAATATSSALVAATRLPVGASGAAAATSSARRSDCDFRRRFGAAAETSSASSHDCDFAGASGAAAATSSAARRSDCDSSDASGAAAATSSVLVAATADFRGRFSCWRGVFGHGQRSDRFSATTGSVMAGRGAASSGHGRFCHLWRSGLGGDAATPRLREGRYLYRWGASSAEATGETS